MILERQNRLNIAKLQEQLGITADLDQLQAFADYYQLCHQAVNEVATKLENLDEDYATHYEHNPIHHMETRMKDPASLSKKLQNKHLPLTQEAIRANIFDLGGIRVIANYVDDVYTVAENLLAQTDIQLLRRKDYIETPKPSGYRSLHLVVSVPVFQSSGVTNAPVEIQLRTIGMDLWASLEHKLRYKTATDAAKLAPISQELTHYAGELANIETHMQAIFDQLNDDD